MNSPICRAICSARWRAAGGSDSRRWRGSTGPIRRRRNAAVGARGDRHRAKNRRTRLVGDRSVDLRHAVRTRARHGPGVLGGNPGGGRSPCSASPPAAWKLAPRDHFIGWTPRVREKNLPLVVDNPRFLILPWITIPNLGSHILAIVRRRLPQDWTERYAIAASAFELPGTLEDRRRRTRDRFRPKAGHRSGQTHLSPVGTCACRFAAASGGPDESAEFPWWNGMSPRMEV